ncbi:MAG: DUF2304 domain-containing protein [Clostridia bacterium]|nr:DUF2304 domain-containing protein [Clostridia bacterium]
MVNVYFLAILFSLIFLLAVVDLVRRRRLKEQYSLLWLLVGFLMLFLSLSRVNLEMLAAWLDIKYAPAMLFLFGLIFSFILILHLTVVISKMSERVVILTQEFAILREQLQEKQKVEKE